MTTTVRSKEELIYDLIFSTIDDYQIDIADYIPDIYRYDKFISEIKKILKKSKVSIIKEDINIDSKSVIWKLKVKK